MICAMHRTLRW
jgi:hypothetical protein